MAKVATLKAKAVQKTETQAIVITPPNLLVVQFDIRGIAPYVQNKFSQKAIDQIMETQKAGSQSRSKKKREPKDFEAAAEAAKHYSKDGWVGIPCGAFRDAMIAACRLVGFKMTHAKLAISLLADGYDKTEGTPLVRITEGEPQTHIGPVRLETGVIDIRARPMWDTWGAVARVQYDGDVFSLQDISNLFQRAGQQVGVGEGRPNGRKGNGCGWGLFTIVSEDDEAG
jgi:hypothetical protein